MKNYGRPPCGLEFYLDASDLDFLFEYSDVPKKGQAAVKSVFEEKYEKIQRIMSETIEEHKLVKFIPLSIVYEQLLDSLMI
jgi:hypothetical protein